MKYFLKYRDLLYPLILSLFLVPGVIFADINGTPSPGAHSLTNPLGVNSVCSLVIALVNAAIVIGIPIAILFVVWAGFMFILARGNPGKLEVAKKNLLYVIIGIAIFVGASLIASVIVNTLHQLGVQGINSC